uniref:UVR domain-containing protein n=1 Tax=Ostreococcus sp. 'lucimarinus' TaxID=242159 RepID=A0A7R9T0R6_9CHLO|mmetsp:Transcript_2960/g.11386  ORF Transcript_2960/g.11386 Transcript_2960/m.11386 type:complete len:260 (+) Transcript_2960:72-851(+)
MTRAIVARAHRAARTTTTTERRRERRDGGSRAKPGGRAMGTGDARRRVRVGARAEDAGEGRRETGTRDETRGDGDADADADGDGLAYRAASAPTKTDYEFALRTAIRDENYEEAARLRDLIDSVSRDAARAVQDANEGFYRAFRDASVSAMRAVWAEGAHVQCLHPGSAVVSGARDVMESWEIIFASMPDGGADVQCADVRVHAGDGWGFATCVERVSGGASLAATNVFERQLDGSWRMVLHQAHGVMSLGAAPTKVDW